MQRRKRDPEGTRLAILEAAGRLLARDGPEGLSVSQVAHLAGVNRGTAYQHFLTREQLLEATTAWMSERLRSAVFGDDSLDKGELPNVQGVVEHMAEFAMENPELGRVWLFEMLSANRPANDPFWKEYRAHFERFAQSEVAQPGIDAEVHSVMLLISTFLWPVFARAHACTAKERQAMARRFSSEVLRLSLHGTIRPEKLPEFHGRATTEGGAVIAKQRSR